MFHRKKVLKEAFIQTIPVLMGYLFIGIAFGVLLEEKGYHFGWAILMSVLIYAGSMQFVAINFLVPGIGLLHVVFMTLMINIRHFFYGLSMLEQFKEMGKKKPYMIFSLTDETYSLLCGAKIPKGMESNRLFFYIALFDQIYWIIGSAIGAIAGSVISFNSKGIDFAMTALFVVIFVEQWLSSKNHSSAIIGLFSSFLCLFLFGANNFILPSMILIVGILLSTKKILKIEVETTREEVETDHEA